MILINGSLSQLVVFLAGVLSLCTIGAGGHQDASKTSRVELVDERGDDSNVDESLRGISIYLSINPHQTDISQGLHAVAEFHNNSSEIVSLRDIYDSTNLEILTKEGWPLKTPQRAPASLIHTMTPPGQSKAPNTIQLEAGKEVSIPLEIKQIELVQDHSSKPDAAGGSSQEPVPPNKVVPLPAGDYRVRLRVILIPDSQFAHGPRSLVSKFVSVSLGP